ncbi:MAG TPA: hypothetical protein VJO53_10800 [Candidatus Acidoferrales bacterium]|nr:hypothetical protein [Candidatus Acidoferrales bacterium]
MQEPEGEVGTDLPEGRSDGRRGETARQLIRRAKYASRQGKVFCSTEKLGPFPNLYDVERATSPWVPDGDYGVRVEFEYSTKLIVADTLRSYLRRGERFSIIAEHVRTDRDILVFAPVVMGFPWLESDGRALDFDPMFLNRDFFENYIEDIDQFSKVSETPEPPDPEPMKHVAEAAFKSCLAKILGDAVRTDWGGETSDFYSAHLHIKGSRTAAAFLLKGPARFEPMGLNHLGKNNDQIYRLSQEPAGLLVVQHCHDILPPVRATLRAFAVQPSNLRRYCLIDGRDSLRLLQAYGLYKQALEMSQ